jgi:hypothetical protein
MNISICIANRSSDHSRKAFSSGVISHWDRVIGEGYLIIQNALLSRGNDLLLSVVSTVIGRD